MADGSLSGAAGMVLARVSVLIVNYNAGDCLRRCIDALAVDADSAAEIRIVDNGSSDDSLDGIEAPGLTIDRAGTNLGFAAGMNRAAAGAEREFLLLLNPDAELRADDLARLIAELDAHPECVLLGPRVVGADGREQRASRRREPSALRILGEVLPGISGIDRTHTPAPERSIEIEGVSGACMLVRRTAFEAVGGFDTDYPLHFEDLDLFARLRAAGGTLRWVPEVTVRHVGGASSSGQHVRILRAKHRGLWLYLTRHIATGRRAWQRPLWWLALKVSETLRAPFAARRERRAS
ncbi:glycosyltransferase family 2 protein [Wenzhouxiangella sp. XN79A]|uniref:glycosyltransferase n=1 Tax=Wenzhouxiangella sp. XN79A TaxID=2724193 RepID=UPI00144A9284|nr:glycosyltransferase family 2 protein [Wenzhouxiangella sp. XN79A]